MVYSSINLAGAKWGISTIPVLIAAFLLTFPSLVSTLRSSTLFVPRIAAWVLFLLGISIAGVFYATNYQLAIETLVQRFLFTSVVIFFYIVLSSRETLRGATLGLLFITLFSIGMNVAGYLSPGFYSTGSQRAFGFYLNPNTSAMAIVMAMTLSVRAVPHRLRFPYYLAAGLGVLVTFSRGGILCWMLAVVLLEARRLNPRAILKILLFVISLMVGTLICLQLIQSNQLFHLGLVNEDFLSSRGVQRILSITSDDTLNDARIAIFKSGIELASQSPLTGQGLGDPLLDFGGEELQGPHNMYLSLWIQHGLVGLLLLPLLAASIFPLHAQGAAHDTTVFIIIFLFVCLFSHNALTQLHYAAVIALAARMSQSRSV